MQATLGNLCSPLHMVGETFNLACAVLSAPTHKADVIEHLHDVVGYAYCLRHEIFAVGGVLELPIVAFLHTVIHGS